MKLNVIFLNFSLKMDAHKAKMNDYLIDLIGKQFVAKAFLNKIHIQVRNCVNSITTSSGTNIKRIDIFKITNFQLRLQQKLEEIVLELENLSIEGSNISNTCLNALPSEDYAKKKISGDDDQKFSLYWDNSKRSTSSQPTESDPQYVDETWEIFADLLNIDQQDIFSINHYTDGYYSDRVSDVFEIEHHIRSNLTSEV